jgi:hypothetical protein
MSGTSARRVEEVLSGDVLPWERQDGETDAAYQAFEAYLHAEKRRVRDHGPSALNWSSQWHWSIRAHEYDIYMARVDLEDQVRYRRKMNARHRQLAAVGQSKVALEWLNGLTPERVRAFSPADVARFLDVMVRIEREATPAVAMDDLPDSSSAPAHENGFEQRLKDAGLDQVQMSQLAEFLHELDSEPQPPPAQQPRVAVPPAVAQVAVDTDMRAVWREMDSQGEGGVPWGAAPAEVRKPRRGR